MILRSIRAGEKFVPLISWYSLMHVIRHSGHKDHDCSSRASRVASAQITR